MAKYQQLIAVYNAEASLLGEISYVVGKLTGTRSCALCDISHVLAAEKDSFSAFKNNFPVPFFNRHLDELEEEQLALAKEHAPCVLGLDEDGWQLVVPSHHIAQSGKSVKKFSELMYSVIE